MLNNKYIADVTSHPDNYRDDYYPACPVNARFGMLLPNRHEAGNEYRYGYQGSEKDDEIKGEGNSYTTHFRQLDPRVGRFFAVDPLTAKYPFYTPYSFSGNKVIHSIELEGLEEVQLSGDARYGNLFAPILNSITCYSTPNCVTIDLSKTENSEIKKRIENTLGLTLHTDWIIHANINEKTESKYIEEEYLGGATGVEITDNTIYHASIIVYDLNGNVIYEKDLKIIITDESFGIILDKGDTGIPERYIWNPSNRNKDPDIEESENYDSGNKSQSNSGWQNVKIGDSVTVGTNINSANVPLFIKINDSTIKQPVTSGYISPSTANQLEVYNISAKDSVFNIISINHNGDTTNTDVSKP